MNRTIADVTRILYRSMDRRFIWPLELIHLAILAVLLSGYIIFWFFANLGCFVLIGFERVADIIEGRRSR